jgi:excisionase family DNA binding protein
VLRRLSVETLETSDSLLTPDQIGKVLRVTTATVRAMLRTGAIPCGIDIGSGQRPRWRLRKSDLDAWLVSRKVPA